MTPMDRARFTQAFNRMAVALRLPVDEGDGAMKQIYWDGLEDLPVEAVEDAARELALEAQWFPKLAEWRTLAEKAKHARVLKMALPASRENPWKAECETCDDTGWEELSCAGNSVCGRLKEHAKHTFVVACVCRATNRTYQRKMAEQRERARGRQEASRQGGGRRSGDFTRVGD